MLVLARYSGEEIMIGANIRVMVIDVRSDGRVRIGIEAPKHIPVDRLEIRDEMERRRARQLEEPEDAP